MTESSSEPKIKATGYKLFALKKNRPGELYPPMVPNPNDKPTPTGIWIEAKCGVRAADSKTGRPRVQAGGKGTNTGKTTLAFRPGWHLSFLPEAKQFLVKNRETGLKDLFPENLVFAECEYACDKNYQSEAETNGMTRKGKYRHSLAGLQKVPENGFYVYRTNPNPKTDPWAISGKMKVNRLLTDEETNEILLKNGREMQKRKGGNIDLTKYGFDKNGKL